MAFEPALSQAASLWASAAPRPSKARCRIAARDSEPIPRPLASDAIHDDVLDPPMVWLRHCVEAVETVGEPSEESETTG